MITLPCERSRKTTTKGSHLKLFSTRRTKMETMIYLSVEPLCGFCWPQITFTIRPPLPTQRVPSLVTNALDELIDQRPLVQGGEGT